MALENKYDAELRARAVIMSVTEDCQWPMAEKFAMRALRLRYPIPKKVSDARRAGRDYLDGHGWLCDISGTYGHVWVLDEARELLLKWVKERKGQLSVERNARDIAENKPRTYNPQVVEVQEESMWREHSAQLALRLLAPRPPRHSRYSLPAVRDRLDVNVDVKISV